MKQISNIKRYVGELGRTLIGTMKVQCPIYILHLSYTTKDKDPFYPIDRAIMHYIEVQPNPNTQYLAWLLGMEIPLIKHRIDGVLKENGMLILKDDDSSKNVLYEITSYGYDRYFEKNGERPEIRVNDDLVVDGKTLGLLPKCIYQSNAEVSLRYDKNIDKQPHKPLLNTKDESISRLIRKIEKMSRKEREEYEIDVEAHSFSVEQYTPKYINGVYIVFSCDAKGKKFKDIFFEEQFVSIGSLKDGLGKYLFVIEDGLIQSNSGYTRQQGEDLSETLTSFYPRKIELLLTTRYSLASISENDYSYNQNSEIYPLTVSLTNKLLNNSENKRQLIADARKEVLEIQVKQGGIFYIKADVDKSLSELIDIDMNIDKWKEKNGTIDYQFVGQELGYDSNWRKNLLQLGRTNDLEEIDISRFIQAH